MRVARLFDDLFRTVQLDDDKENQEFWSNQQQGEGPTDKILIQESGKLVFLLALLDNLKSEGHRCLIFSQSRKMLDIIDRILTHRVGSVFSIPTHICLL